METTPNWGPEIKEYLISVGFNQPVPWCAAFVSWNMEQCGIKGAKSAWSPSWFPKNKTIWQRGTDNKAVPRTGDVGGIYYASLGRIGHVFFIDEWPTEGGFASTVEGNSNGDGSREGNAVVRKRRMKRSIYKVSRWI